MPIVPIPPPSTNPPQGSFSPLPPQCIQNPIVLRLASFKVCRVGGRQRESASCHHVPLRNSSKTVVTNHHHHPSHHRNHTLYQEWGKLSLIGKGKKTLELHHGRALVLCDHSGPFMTPLYLSSIPIICRSRYRSYCWHRLRLVVQLSVPVRRVLIVRTYIVHGSPPLRTILEVHHYSSILVTSQSFMPGYGNTGRYELKKRTRATHRILVAGILGFVLTAQGR